MIYVYRRYYKSLEAYGVEVSTSFSPLSLLPTLFFDEGVQKNAAEAAYNAINMLETWSLAFEGQKKQPVLFFREGEKPPFQVSKKWLLNWAGCWLAWKEEAASSINKVGKMNILLGMASLTKNVNT